MSNHLTANIWTQGIWCGVTTLFKTFRIIFIGIVFAETEKSLVISKCHIISQRTTAESTPAVTFPGPCLLWHVNMYSPKGTHYIPYSLLSWWWVSQKDTVTQPPLPPQLLSRGWGTKPGSMSQAGWGTRLEGVGILASGEERKQAEGSSQEEVLLQTPKEPHLGISMDTPLHVGVDPSRGSWLPREK